MNENTTQNWVASALYGADDPEPMTARDAGDLVNEWLKEGSILPEDIPADYTPELFAAIWNRHITLDPASATI